MGQSSIVSTTTKMTFEFAMRGPTQVDYIDLAQCLSILNRRSYRQGMNYAVSDVEFTCNTTARSTLSIIPTTWVADNATTKAFESWKDQRAEVLKEQPSLKAKWSDFKVFMDSTHAFLGVPANLTPIWYNPANFEQAEPFNLGTWDVSEYVCPLPGAAQAAAGDAQEVRLHVIGDNLPAGPFDINTTNVGLIDAYANSRAVILHPDPTVLPEFATGFYNVNSLPDEMQVDVMDNVANRNDNPPYDDNEYPGGSTNGVTTQFVDTAFLNNFGDDSSFSVDRIGSFVPPLGLIRLYTTADENTVVTVTVNLVPGNYKGILAERGL